MPASERLSAEANRLAAVALGHVTREYPNKLDHVLAGPRTPARRARCTRSSTAASTGIPASTATGCWPACCAASRTLPTPPRSARCSTQPSRRTRSPASAPISPRPRARGFERPYGWGWLLKLAGRADARMRTRRWARGAAPLAEAFADRFTRLPAQGALSDPQPAPIPTPPSPCARARLRRGARRRRR